MTDCFLSYSSRDESFAQFVHDELVRRGITVFKASTSLRPGERWSPRVQDALRQASWVIVLASESAVASPWVQQEIGGAIIGGKRVVPVVWDRKPESLPGWLPEHQAIDLSGSPIELLRARMGELAGSIAEEKRRGAVLLAVLILGLVLFSSES